MKNQLPESALLVVIAGVREKSLTPVLLGPEGKWHPRTGKQAFYKYFRKAFQNNLRGFGHKIQLCSLWQVGKAVCV